MPMVGDKKFSYTGEGKRKAKQYATETSNDRSKMASGNTKTV